MHPAPTLGDGLTPGLAALRDALLAAGFAWKTVLERLGAFHMPMFPYPLEELEHLDTPHLPDGDRPPVDWLIKALVLGETVERSRLERPLPAAAFGALLDSGLLAETDCRLEPRCVLLPWRGLFLACDLPVFQGQSEAVRIPDLSTAFTCGLLPPLSGEPCDRMLDIGTGCGAVALAGARHFREVRAVDITARAVEFARFNAVLNGLAVSVGRCADSPEELSRPDGGYDLITFVLPLVYPHFYRHGSALAVRTEQGERLLLDTYRAAVRLLSPEGRALLWHQILIDPPDHFSRLLEEAGLGGLSVLVNTVNLGSSAWSFTRSQVTRSPGDIPTLRQVPVPDPFGPWQTREDLLRALATEEVVKEAVEIHSDAVPRLFPYVTCGQQWSVHEGRLLPAPAAMVTGMPEPPEAVALLMRIDGRTRVRELLAGSPDPEAAHAALVRFARRGLIDLS